MYLCPFFRGYEGLITHIMNELPKDIVLFNKPVKCIHWNNQLSSGGGSCPVKVECVNGETFEADHVIVTIPLGMFSLLHHPYIICLLCTFYTISCLFLLVISCCIMIKNLILCLFFCLDL